MWSDILNKPKNGTPFRKDHARLMNVPLGYNNNVERQNTHHDLLPKDESLETAGIKRSRVPSRSVLDNTTNRGILRKYKKPENGRNVVTWFEMTHSQMGGGFD